MDYYWLPWNLSSNVKILHEFGRLFTISWFFRNKLDRNRNKWLGMLEDCWVISKFLLQKAGKGGDKGGKGNANKGGGGGAKSGGGGAGGGKKGLLLLSIFDLWMNLQPKHLTHCRFFYIFRWQKMIHHSFCMRKILLTFCMSLAVAVFIFLYKIYIFKRVFHQTSFSNKNLKKFGWYCMQIACDALNNYEIYLWINEQRHSNAFLWVVGEHWGTKLNRRK